MARSEFGLSALFVICIITDTHNCQKSSKQWGSFLYYQLACFATGNVKMSRIRTRKVLTEWCVTHRKLLKVEMCSTRLMFFDQAQQLDLPPLVRHCFLFV